MVRVGPATLAVGCSFMTGGAFTEAATRFVERCDRPVRVKPIRAATLREAVSDALAELSGIAAEAANDGGANAVESSV